MVRQRPPVYSYPTSFPTVSPCRQVLQLHAFILPVPGEDQTGVTLVRPKGPRIVGPDGNPPLSVSGSSVPRRPQRNGMERVVFPTLRINTCHTRIHRSPRCPPSSMDGPHRTPRQIHQPSSQSLACSQFFTILIPQVKNSEGTRVFCPHGRYSLRILACMTPTSPRVARIPYWRQQGLCIQSALTIGHRTVVSQLFAATHLFSRKHFPTFHRFDSPNAKPPPHSFVFFIT